MSEKTPLTPENNAALTEETAAAAVPETAEEPAIPAEETTVSAEETTTPADAEKKPRRKRGKKADADLTPEEKEKKEKEKEKKKKDKPKDAKKAAKRLIGYIADHKRGLIVVALCVILTSVIGAVGALIMKPVYAILEAVVNGGEAKASAVGIWVDGKINGDVAMQEILKYLLVMAIAYIVSTALSLLYTRIMLKITVTTVAQLRRELFNHLQGLPIGYFDSHKVGEIMSRFTSDVNRVSDLVSDSFPTIISAVVQGGMTLVIMLIYSWQITLIMTGALVLIVLVIIAITSICSPLFKKQQKAMGECNGYIEEYIMGIKAVKIFCYEDRSKAQFRELNEAYRRIGVKANIIGGFMGPIISMIARVNYAIAVSIGALFVVNGTGGMDVARLVTFLSYASGYGGSIASIAGCYSALISALAGAERIFEVLDTPFEPDEGNVRLAKVVSGIMGYEESDDDTAVAAWKIPAADGSVRYTPVEGNIQVKDVTFAYVEGKNVIKHLTVDVPSGKKVAFVGSTGAGKTTITNLINRFYEIENGEITIDGINIKDIKKDDLRHSMAFVLQDVGLFADTIKENIRYGRLDATDDEIVAAAKVANAHAFIEKLPDGYDTQLRSDGVNLSAGQAQLLNIARAALADRPVLVLDEATSSVDTRTERLIEHGMDQLMAGKTVLVIAHRLSTVRNSDDILVLENGEVIEEGSHQALIDLGQKYYQLYTGMFEMT